MATGVDGLIYRKILDLERGEFARWNVVPNIEPLATYSFTTQTIELSEFGSEDYKLALSGVLGLQKKASVLLAHEYRHWLDHIGSLWGQQMLCLGYNALNARLLNKPEELWRIVKFRQALRDNRFERYYQTIESIGPKGLRRIWKYQMSSGARFDHNGRASEQHPILFTRFAWEDDRQACRVPMSVSALLETSAMCFELRAEKSFITLLPEREQSAAWETVQRKFLDTMYDPELAEYSVAVHAVSNFVGPSDCESAFDLSAVLASIALNLTESHFRQLRVPDSVRNWGGRNDAFLANMDRGYAFLILAKVAPRVPIRNVDEWVEQTLDAAGLPNLETIKADAIAAAEALSEDLVDGPLVALRERHRLAGIKLLTENGPVFKFTDIFRRLTEGSIPAPPIVLGKDLTISADGEILDWDASPVSAQMKALLGAYSQCDEFADACGV
jgi:hypothetical protein